MYNNLVRRKKRGGRVRFNSDKYDMIRPLGQGAGSNVFLVRHRMLDDLRAVKRVRKDRVRKEQFLNEADILKNLKHSNIPVIYDIEEDKDYYYLIEEYVQGESLRAYRLSHKKFSEKVLIDFALQICNILVFLHSLPQPIWYLDLKPENIIVSKERLKLIDFGASERGYGQKRKYSYGTRGFAAPEQFGINCVDARTDIYGVGALLFFMVSGEMYSGKGSLKYVTELDCSQKLKKVIQRCLRYLPAQRYLTVASLIKDLKRLQRKEHGADSKERTPQIYCVCGVSPGVGTTHICLMMAGYLNRRGIPALYVEAKDHQTVCRMRQSGRMPEDFPAACGEIGDVIERYGGYQTYICDYGSWKENAGFPSGDRRFLVMGGKIWEQEAPQIEKTEYLINLAGNEDFIRTSGRYGNARCIRVPYVPELFTKRKDKIEQDFMEEILAGP